LLIEEEQKKIKSIPNYSKGAFDSLNDMKRAHRESVKFLTQAIANKSQENVRIDDVIRLRDQLMALKHTGTQFRQMIELNVHEKQKEFKYQEKIALEL